MEVAKRISDEAHKITIGVFFAIAVVITSARMIIRIRLHKKLRLDDFCIGFAAICLAGATGISYYVLSLNHFIEQLSRNSSQSSVGGIDETTALRHLIFYQRCVWAYSVLSWTVLFATKFGYLCLFKSLVDRIPYMYAIWKFVIALTILAFGFTFCSIWLFCPNDGLAGSRCLSLTGQYDRAVSVTYVTITLDIITDLFILIIPVYLIWLLKARTRQKLELAAFLCLSFFMIILAIVRIGGLSFRDRIDRSWNHFWFHLESCTAVIMLSGTAFRSLFVSAVPKGNRTGPWVPSTGRLRGRHKHRAWDRQDSDDITTPTPSLRRQSQILDGTPVKLLKSGTLTLESWPLRFEDQEPSMQV